MIDDKDKSTLEKITGGVKRAAEEVVDAAKSALDAAATSPQPAMPLGDFLSPPSLNAPVGMMLMPFRKRRKAKSAKKSLKKPAKRSKKLAKKLPKAAGRKTNKKDSSQ
jgi:hypothetical protein